MEILVKTAQFILSLSILIVLHELGHFLFAKLFKARVEKFYLFFNPCFQYLSFKKVKPNMVWVGCRLEDMLK